MQTHTGVDVQFVPDEAEAVVSILRKRSAGDPIAAEDWQALFTCEGYARLKRREESMGTAFADADFQAFVLSEDLLSRQEALASALSAWLAVDVNAAAGRALDYLPAGTPIRAKVYPVIKPKTNSFVFEVESSPAIFLYLDPLVTPQKLENTLIHELHHIGIAAAQQPIMQSAEWKALPETTRQMLEWVTAFGEGIAMLAAAGGPEVHPHAASSAADRARWDRDMLNFAADLREVEKFLSAVLSGQLQGQAMWEAGFRFFGVQGPWYTVGWKMAATIEQAYGREAVIEAFCDPRRLLECYNRVASEVMPKWSDALAHAAE